MGGVMDGTVWNMYSAGSLSVSGWELELKNKIANMKCCFPENVAATISKTLRLCRTGMLH